MKDRVPAKPNRFAVYDDSHNFLRYEYHERADEPTEPGNPLNKAFFMPDTLATTLGLTPTTATVADGIGAVLVKAKGRTILYDGAPTVVPFIVDVSSIDFTKVRRVVAEFYNVTTSTDTSKSATFAFRDQSGTSLSGGMPTKPALYQQSAAVSVFMFGEAVNTTYAMWRANVVISAGSGVLFWTDAAFNRALIKQIYVSGEISTSISGRRVVIWCD